MNSNPDRLRRLATTLRDEARDADVGAEESRMIADLFDAAASEDFTEFGDVRQVLRCVEAMADGIEAAITEEAKAA